jgi:hypothetical protein
MQTAKSIKSLKTFNFASVGAMMLSTPVTNFVEVYAFFFLFCLSICLQRARAAL